MVISAVEWLQKTQTEKQAALSQLVYGQSNIDYTSLITSGRWGIVASLGQHFDYAVFGRDSIRVAKDLLDTHQVLARNIILTLARLQGTQYNTISEEEPGKIHHEYRNMVFDGKQIPQTSIDILRDLQHWWGGEGTNEMIYYGSTDTTPLYIRLVAAYADAYGQGLLDETITGRDGRVRTIREVIKLAVGWVVQRIEASPWGLLEYKRLNPNGIANQAWKDSKTAYMHADGSIAAYDKGIAAIEMQGYAYDALLDANRLLDDGPADTWYALAKHIQQTTLQAFWMEEDGYFAQGLDRNSHGTMRQIDTLTSNPALLLRSRLLYDAEPKRRDFIVERIINMLLSQEFLTQGGIRCRALRHKNIPGFPDYHGTYTTWPKETYEIAKGLHYHGYSTLAHDLEIRILNTVLNSGEFYEFYYVNDDGTVWYDRDAAIKQLQPHAGNHQLPVPEAGQAWTISAVTAMLNRTTLPLSAQPSRAPHTPAHAV